MKQTLYGLSCGLVLLPFSALAENTSPWLPAPGQLSVGASYTQQTAKDAYIGENRLSITDITGGAADEYTVDTASVLINYGLSDSLSLDASLSYAEIDAGAADDDSGLSDSTIGLQWRVVDGQFSDFAPTVTLRTAAIIAGNYESDRLASLGKAANGLELSAIVGKRITSYFSLWGELGYQNRDSSVPDAIHYNINAGVRLSSSFSFSAGYSRKEFSGDLDIGGEGFTPARFAEVNEQRSLIKGSLNYAIAQNQAVSLTLARSLDIQDSRNSNYNGQIVSVAYNYGFN